MTSDDLRKDVQGVNKAITAIDEIVITGEHVRSGWGSQIGSARLTMELVRNGMMEEIRFIETGIPRSNPRGPGLNTAANRPEPEPVFPPGTPVIFGKDTLEEMAKTAKKVLDGMNEGVAPGPQADAVTSTEPEPPEVEVSEEGLLSDEFWSLEEILPLSKGELITLAEQENIKIDKKALKKDIFKKVKKGLGL